MQKDSFKHMWEVMQQEGYFKTHPHYTDHFGASLSDADKQLDAMLLTLDYTQDAITMPVPYSEALERAVKRTESMWLPTMFKIPGTGTVLDIGCGFGRTVAWLQPQYSQVLATDISAEAIAFARDKFQHAGNVQFFVNEADALPAEIAPGSIDFAYAFTVFQHMPREFALSLLTQTARCLNVGGVVAFNLLSGINEAVDSGDAATEWAIGYSKEQAQHLLESAGLKPQRFVVWSRSETSMTWLWVLAGR